MTAVGRGRGSSAPHLVKVALCAVLLIVVLMVLSVAGWAREAYKQETSGAFTQAVRLQLGADGPREVPDLDRTWIARADDVESIYEVMTDDGYVFVERFGSGHMFEKDGESSMLDCRMYTSQFTLCERPE